MPSYWTRLEMFCRDLTNVYDEVRVVSGPLFLLEEDNTTGKSLVKYEVGIATNSVTHRCLQAQACPGYFEALRTHITRTRREDARHALRSA